MTHGFAWALLIIAGFLDVLWAVSMKYAEGYTRLGWSIISLALLAGFVFLLGRSLKVLPIGTAYAVWTGVGAVGTMLMGVALFGESRDPLRLSAIGLVGRASPSSRSRRHKHSLPARTRSDMLKSVLALLNERSSPGPRDAHAGQNNCKCHAFTTRSCVLLTRGRHADSTNRAPNRTGAAQALWGN